MKLSVVIPCFNEQESLSATLKRVMSVAEPICQEVEVVLVDDGSKDSTWPIISTAAAGDSRVRGIRLSRNFGHQIALSAGLYAATGDRIFIIDADLQDPPELLCKMMAVLDDGADVAYGRRVSRGGESAAKLGTAFLFYRVINWLSDIDIPKDTGDFRLVSRRALNAVLAMPEKHRFLRGMFAWVGFQQVPVDYDRAERFAGETKYPFAAMLRFAVTAITSFSVRPLRLAMMFAGLFAIAALLAVAYVVVGHFTGHTVQGWSSLMVVVLLIASCQFLLLGIIGEYLGRMFVEQKKRPLFVIMSDTGKEISGS